LDAIEELIARSKIHQLADRYALAVDGKDVDGLAVLFVEDVDNGRYGPGRDGVRTYFDTVLRGFHCTMHLVANHVIDFDDDDDHARGVVYCRAHHHVLEPEHWYDRALAYWDSYDRVGDDWFFRRRRLKAWYSQRFGHPLHGTERVAAEAGTEGATRGSRMPEAFPAFEAFWSRTAPSPAPRRD
jgi:SnoaL-like domain